MRVDFNTSGLSVRIVHLAACPGVSAVHCAEYDIPTHTHDQGVKWLRLQPTFNVGLGKGLQATLSLPFDVRALTINYYTLDGASYEPPYGGIHHRDEVLTGVVDPEATLQWFGRVGEALTIGGGAGVLIPLGKTEPDPYEAGAAGQEHQHFQFGTGTVVPTARATAVYAPTPRWGGFAWAGGQLPLYANSYGYRAPRRMEVGGGPTFRPSPSWQLLPTVEATVEGPEYWGDTPYAGRAALMGGLTALYTARPGLVLQGQARTTLGQWEKNPTDGDDGEGQITQRLVLSLGASWTLGSPKHEESPEAEADEP